jgi:hypothetical protein
MVSVMPFSQVNVVYEYAYKAPVPPPNVSKRDLNLANQTCLGKVNIHIFINIHPIRD